MGEGRTGADAGDRLTSERPADAATPSVSVIIPTYNEERHIEKCLEAVASQTYRGDIEVLVVDGRSTDETRALCAARGVTVLDNAARIQAAAMNIGLHHAAGEVVVRVDGHCQIQTDYIERAISALLESGAAMVGGAMTPTAGAPVQRGIARAMSSRLGAGTARFHIGGAPGWVDTVYLGIYWRHAAMEAGGYAEDVGVNEDAEFAHRMRAYGGVWFDPSIRSTYTPRDSLRAVARQFYRYGRSRARTAIRHPASVSLRQLAAPILVIALMTRLRKPVLAAYGSAVIARTAFEARSDRAAAGWYGLTLPAMHFPWGVGFLLGLVLGPPRGISPQHPPSDPVDMQQQG